MRIRPSALTARTFLYAGLTLLATLAGSENLAAQALTMDGGSGVFFAPLATVVPASSHKFAAVTSVHVVGLSPVFGNLYNVGVEFGYGDRLEFGYTRNFHTDGGSPTVSPLVNYDGMNLFNAKIKILKGGYKGGYLGMGKFVPVVSVGGVLRTNDPYISKQIAGVSRTNGDIYGVVTEIVPMSKKVLLLLDGGVRGTNAETHGFDGEATNFQARAFGAVGFPIPLEKKYLLIPAFEIDQEPHKIKDATTTTWPSTLVYAVRFTPLNFKYTIEAGMGHVAGRVSPTTNLKANNGIAFGYDYHF